MGIINSLLGNASTMSNEQIQKKYAELFIESETIEIGFNMFRDTFIFTNKRLILIDVSGLTGSKVEYKSIAYKSISSFSVESTGTFDLDAELKIWIYNSNVLVVSKKFSKSVNVYQVQRILATHVL